MKILLHICCAPCGIYPFKELLKDPSNHIKGFYFNPNIHPKEEYQRRRAALEQYSRTSGLEVIYPECNPDDFFKKIINNDQRPSRCGICWRMRLEETALAAANDKFDAFTTTLLISPYQDNLVIKTIGEDLAKRHDIKFYYRDFREGFRQSQNEARDHNLYRQKYCGCIYSLKESSRK
ncbi:MAG: epoxyqueuosine reductase QueH [Candidatus Omnitrophica bacterium]|nr:epoxyqueuosine reductase QueH [Candidatus Omnitrophota bacterium]